MISLRSRADCSMARQPSRVARQPGSRLRPLEDDAGIAAAEAHILLVLRLIARAAAELLADLGALLDRVLVLRPAPGYQLVPDEVAVAVVHDRAGRAVLE